MFLTAILATPIWAQPKLPDAPGKDTTLSACTNCHGTEMFADYRKTQSDWDSVISSMMDKGLSVNDADYNTILNYLSKNLAPLPDKLNINKATAGDIRLVLVLTPEQADAIVKYREKNGDFKDLDTVKKVAGIAAADIDSKKDKITF